MSERPNPTAEPGRSWWHPGWPDMRGWVTIGFFGVTFFVLLMIRENPKLLANASFMQLAGALMTGGPLLIATNLFGGTKSGADASAKTADALKAITERPAGDPPPKA